MVLSQILNFIRHAGLFPGSDPFWRPERDIPDMTGKVVVVTGANTGIGYESVKYLLKAGAKVYALSRTAAKGEAAVKSLNDLGYKGEAIFVQCDLADLSTLRRSAEEILGRDQQIHVLINNAGIMCLTQNGADQKTAQGHEIQFGTNCLGHHLLTNLLSPALIAAASQSGKGSARIVFVSSFGHKMFTTEQLLEHWDLSDEAAKQHKPDVLYGRSKLGNIHQMHGFADRLESKGVVVAAVHPGLIESELHRHDPAGGQGFLMRSLTWPVYYGAICQLYAGTAIDDDIHRSYYVPWARKAQQYSQSTDKAMIQKTMQWCDEQSGGF